MIFDEYMKIMTLNIYIYIYLRQKYILIKNVWNKSDEILEKTNHNIPTIYF